MGLRIQNNIAAMNAHRQLSISDSGLSKSLERLSSGYRINRAADDAAGLAISQQFRADIASFKVASRNTAEASSLLQVAEGAMDQIGNMLTRLKELATQAASANAGSNLNKLEAEKANLILEIDRIANSTKYAGSNLLDGTFGEVSSTWERTGITTGEKILDGVTGRSYSYANLSAAVATWENSAIAAGDAFLDSVNGLRYQAFAGNVTLDTITFTATPAALKAQTYTFTNDGTARGLNLVGTDGTTYIGILSADSATTLTFAGLGLTILSAAAMTTAAGGNIEGDAFAVTNAGFSSISADNTTHTTGTWTITNVAASNSVTITNSAVPGHTQTLTTVDGVAQTLDFDALGIKLTLNSGYADGDLSTLSFTVAAGSAAATPTLSFTFDGTPALTAQKYTLEKNGTQYGMNLVGANGETYAGIITNTPLTGTTAAFDTLLFDTIGLSIVGAFGATLTTLSTGLGLDTLTVADTGFSSMSVASTTTTGTWTITNVAASNSMTLTNANGSDSQVITTTDGIAQTLDFDQLGIKLTLGSAYADGDFAGIKFDVDSSGSSTFQVGAENTANDRISISIGKVTTAADGLNLATLDLTTSAGAQAALDTINDAISSLGDLRGDVGAAMNRLTYAAANLSTTIENVQAAESMIRDVDMAAEMTTFTKNQILLQAGTAMLAQANMAPQNILSLFGG